MKRIKAWHFLREDSRLGYGDRRLIKPGTTVTVSDKPVLCHRGLHGSRRLIDALQYAPGPILCRVTIGGEIVEGDDKLAGTKRHVEWVLDATHVLHEFACRVAEKALRDREVTDHRSWDAIKVKRLWLAGEASDADLSAAWDAAWDAARDAAWDAARDAAWAAARDAAWAAAWDAAWDAARDAQNKILTRMVNAVPYE